MARQGKGIFDGFSGSVSKVTGYKSKGKSIVKSKSKESEKTQTQSLVNTKIQWVNWMKLYSVLNYTRIRLSISRLNLQLTEINKFIKQIAPVSRSHDGWHVLNVFGGKKDISKYFTFEFTVNPTNIYFSIQRTGIGFPTNWGSGSRLFIDQIGLNGTVLFVKTQISAVTFTATKYSYTMDKVEGREMYWFVSIYNINGIELSKTICLRINPV